MTPRHDYALGNVTNGRELHETRSREYVLGELKRLGLMHIADITSSYKPQTELDKEL